MSDQQRTEDHGTIDDSAAKQSALLPCPFCGEPGELRASHEAKPIWVFPHCSSCDANIDGWFQAEAACDAWNGRLDDDLHAQITARLAAADGEAVRLRATIHNKDVCLTVYRIEHEQLTARVTALEGALCGIVGWLPLDHMEDVTWPVNRAALERVRAALADVPAAARGE